MRAGIALPLIASMMALAACRGGSSIPDVSGIRIELKTVRYERLFFSIDTLDIPGSLRRLQTTEPGFTELFMGEVLGLPPGDSSAEVHSALRSFLRDYRPILNMAEKAVGNMDGIEAELSQSLKLVKYYFPGYETPKRLYTFIGPINAIAEGRTASYGDIITPHGLGIGLQLHLGANSPLYQSEEGSRLYPAYLSRRFEAATIAVNCMKNVIDDLFPGKKDDRNLLDYMVDKGKRLYLLDLFMPETPDTLKIGYTKAQLEGAFEHEGLIWNHLVSQNLLYESDPQRIRPYLTEGPMTQELGEGSPGYIGLFTGRQIIRAYMGKFPKTKLQELMEMPAKDILEGARYKPR